MFNPFASFDPKYVAGFQKNGIQAFVKQTYDRGKNLLESPVRPAFLFIHFLDGDMARLHYEAIETDSNRELFTLKVADDWKAFRAYLLNPDHLNYMALTVKDVNAKAKKSLDKHIRAYIDHRTDWHPRRSDDIDFSMEFIFGEIYAVLRFGARKIKLRIDDLENQKYVL